MSSSDALAEAMALEDARTAKNELKEVMQKHGLTIDRSSQGFRLLQHGQKIGVCPFSWFWPEGLR